jgi:hypothetical protein
MQVLYENQRCAMRMHQDAVNVESTSSALLVCFARDGIGDLQEIVATWLNTMRNCAWSTAVSSSFT